MSRSTFSILPYINRQKVKADGTANILCRITVDGKSAAISTGISCTPQEWNAKKGEVRNARDNGRLASFLAEVKDKYNSLLTANGIITVEMLKAVLKDKDTTGKFLLSFGDTIVEWYRTSKARQTFLHKRTWQKNLKAFAKCLTKSTAVSVTSMCLSTMRELHSKSCLPPPLPDRYHRQSSSGDNGRKHTAPSARHSPPAYFLFQEYPHRILSDRKSVV